jgi:trans-aconitate methyltransferase
MTTMAEGLSVSWLALREPADAVARATDLADEVRRLLAGRPRIVVHDLGCGTGSMGRWLAPLLPGPQRWVLYDRDPALVEHASGRPPHAGDGSAVAIETRLRDISRLDAAELVGADLVTASALLDMLTADELARLVATCASAGCPVLVTLSVIGRVELTPSDPIDTAIDGAFNAHQRRETARGRLLGPDAVRVAIDMFARRGADVVVRSSPWTLGPDDAELLTAWLAGWVAAACEQDPSLAVLANEYVDRRLAELADRRLRATVHHHDFLVVP